MSAREQTLRWPLGPGSSPEPSRSRRRLEPSRVVGGVAVGICFGLYLALMGWPGPADWLASTGPVALPSAAHPLGTDPHGRDLMMGLAHAQAVLYPLVARVVLVAVGGGVVAGVAAALFGGVVGALVGLLCRVLSAFPRLPLVLLVATAIDASFETAAFALGVAFLPDVTSMVREHVDRLIRTDFISAGRAHGLTWGRLLGDHVLRLHVLPGLCRQIAHIFAFSVMVEAGLSYLGRLGRYVSVGDDGDWVRFGRLLWDAKAALDPTFAEPSTWLPLVFVTGFLMLLVGGALVVGERIARALEAP